MLIFVTYWLLSHFWSQWRLRLLLLARKSMLPSIHISICSVQDQPSWRKKTGVEWHSIWTMDLTSVHTLPQPKRTPVMYPQRRRNITDSEYNLWTSSAYTGYNQWWPTSMVLFTQLWFSDQFFVCNASYGWPDGRQWCPIQLNNS